VGDAALTLEGLLAELKSFVPQPRDGAAVAKAIADMREGWLAGMAAQAHRQGGAAVAYRVIWDLMHTVDVDKHHHHPRRRQPARSALAVLGVAHAAFLYRLGQDDAVGYGLGLAMGAKLVHPDKLCINVCGDAAIGFTGMDFETAARNNIPNPSVLFNNFSMACEPPHHGDLDREVPRHRHFRELRRLRQGAGRPWRARDGRREIIPAIKRGIEATRNGKPALLEFINPPRGEPVALSGAGVGHTSAPAPSMGTERDNGRDRGLPRRAIAGTMAPMEFGMFTNFRPWARGRTPSASMKAWAQIDAAEAGGIDALWLAELHFAPERSVLAAPLTIASAIAARTRRIRIGLAVQVLPLCHPLRLAEEAATVDQISRGRLIFGVGRSGRGRDLRRLWRALQRKPRPLPRDAGDRPPRLDRADVLP